MGLTQGLLSALVADTAPAELRGTAFGMFNLVSGIAMLVASVIAGALWDIAGPTGTFLAGAAFTAIALVMLPFARWRATKTRSRRLALEAAYTTTVSLFAARVTPV